MDPRRFQDLAEFLRLPPDQPPEEASFRGACGRGYYAAFGYASELLRAVPCSVPATSAAHKVVAAALKGSSINKVRQAGHYLEWLHECRKSADYDVGSVPPRSYPFNRGTADHAVKRSRQIIECLQDTKGRDPSLGIRKSLLNFP